MTEKAKIVNYYQVLGCEKCATGEELKKRYQCLALSYHPDKHIEETPDTFLLIQKAWSILRDPETRRQYDAELSCHENSDVLLYDTINLSDMNYEAQNEIYTYECRCGGVYYLEISEIVPPSVIISCDECSFSIQINK